MLLDGTLSFEFMEARYQYIPKGFTWVVTWCLGICRGEQSWLFGMLRRPKIIGLWVYSISTLNNHSPSQSVRPVECSFNMVQLFCWGISSWPVDSCPTVLFHFLFLVSRIFIVVTPPASQREWCGRFWVFFLINLFIPLTNTYLASTLGLGV